MRLFGVAASEIELLKRLSSKSKKLDESNGTVKNKLIDSNNPIVMAENSPVWAEELVRRYADRVPPLNGFTDVFIHGTENGKAFAVIYKGNKVILSHREVAGWLKSQGIKGNIRLISCYSGSRLTGSVAQNLSNKLGVTVRAPTNKVTLWPDGSITAPNGTKWRDLSPGGR